MIFIIITTNVLSIVTCFILRQDMYTRGLIHYPIGAIGSILISNSKIHGIMFMYLITLYQCMELYAHMQMYREDYSWIDVEGYLIGFTYTTLSQL
jgi:hypothetical protein